MRFPSIVLFPRLLMITGLGVGISSVLGLSFTPAAQACGKPAIGITPMDPLAENTPVNFHLGMTEEALVQTFGKPQARRPEPVRCPSNRIHLTYAKSLVILSPSTEPQNSQTQNSQTQNSHINQHRYAPNLVVIGLVSTDPQIVITGGIHVGLSAIATTEKLTATCDRDSLETAPSRLSCQVDHQPVNVRIVNNQVSRITIGTVYRQNRDE